MTIGGMERPHIFRSQNEQQKHLKSHSRLTHLFVIDESSFFNGVRRSFHMSKAGLTFQYCLLIDHTSFRDKHDLITESSCDLLECLLLGLTSMKFSLGFNWRRMVQLTESRNTRSRERSRSSIRRHSSSSRGCSRMRLVLLQ